MRRKIALAVTWLTFCSVADAVTLHNRSPDGGFRFKPYFTTGPIPFYFLFDVNGVDHRLDMEVNSTLLYDTETGVAQPITIRDRTLDRLMGFSGGEPFEIVIHGLSHPRGGMAPRSGSLEVLLGGKTNDGERLFYHIYRWVGDGIGDNYGFASGTTSSVGAAPLINLEGETEPMIIQSIEVLDPHLTGKQSPRLVLHGASGPRWIGDNVLFDQVVGGERFTVRLKEFGFGEWGNVVVSIPEPASWLLLSSALAMLWFGRKRLRSQFTVATH